MRKLLTGAEMRHKANIRVKKYREMQAAKGYKNLSLFCSEELRAEFDKLNQERGMSKQDALDHIFKIYKQAIDSENVTVHETFHKTVSVTVHETEPSEEQPTIPPDNQKDKPEEPTPGPLPDCHGKELSVQKRDQYLLQVEAMFPGSGMNRKRAEALNKAGIRTGRNKEWSPKAVGDNLHHAKKRLVQSLDL